MIEPIRLRSSKLNWPDCPRRNAAEIFRPEVEAAGFPLRRIWRPHVGTLVGSAAHAGDAQLYRDLMINGSEGEHRFRVARAVEVGMKAWNERRPPDDRDIEYDGVSPDRRIAERAIRRLIETYATTIDWSEEPIMIEENKGIPLFNGEIWLTSTPDRVLVNGKIPDLKTGSKFVKETAGAQLGGQSLVVRSHFLNMKVNWLGVEHQPRKHPDKIGPPEKIRFPQRPAELHALSCIRQIRREKREWNETVAAGRPDPEVFPARPESFLCSEERCPAFGTTWCSAWQLKVAVTARRKVAL